MSSSADTSTTFGAPSPLRNGATSAAAGPTVAPSRLGRSRLCQEAPASGAATTGAAGCDSTFGSCGGGATAAPEAAAAAVPSSSGASSLGAVATAALGGASAPQQQRSAGGSHLGKRSAGGAEGPAETTAAAGTVRPAQRRRGSAASDGEAGSVCLAVEGELDEYRFSMFMRDVLAEKARDIVHCRGVLAVHGYGDQRFVFEGASDAIRYGPSSTPWQPTEQRVCRVVFVGHGLDKAALTRGFRTCVWHPLPEGWREALDPASRTPYYYHIESKTKTWARPQPSPITSPTPASKAGAAAAVPTARRPGSGAAAGGWYAAAAAAAGCRGAVPAAAPAAD